jgi:restriction system protein
MGYDVAVTRATKDGGIDVLVADREKGRLMRTLIQCKRYRTNVGVTAIRELLGVVTQQQANKGALISTSDFTRTAKREASLNTLLELISFKELNILLNKYLGSNWPTFLTYHIRNSQRRIKTRGATAAPGAEGAFEQV